MGEGPGLDLPKINRRESGERAAPTYLNSEGWVSACLVPFATEIATIDCALGGPSVAMSHFASADQERLPKAVSSAIWFSCPPPAGTSIRPKVCFEFSERRKATKRPSGDHAGLTSACTLDVRRTLDSAPMVFMRTDGRPSGRFQL